MRAEKIPFVLGHALYLKAIHGGKSKNDQIDAENLAKGHRPRRLDEPPDRPAQLEDLTKARTSRCTARSPSQSLTGTVQLNPRFERPAGGTEEFLGRERELAVGVLVTARRLTPRSVFGAVLRREPCETNFPGAEDIRIALNRSDPATDQRENAVPVRGATIDNRVHIWLWPSESAEPFLLVRF